MDRKNKNRAFPAKKENLPIFKRYNVNKSVDFINNKINFRIRSYDQSNMEKIKNIFYDRASDNFSKKGEKIELELDKNNIKGKAEFNENDRYKNCFNKPTGNKMINIHNKNIPLSSLSNFTNISYIDINIYIF